MIRGIGRSGSKEFCYIAATGDNLLKLQQTLKRGHNFDPTDFGIVLEYGVGEPSNEVKEKMTREFGYNHEKALPIVTTDSASASA